MRLLALMENVGNFGGTRVARTPYTLRPVPNLRTSLQNPSSIVSRDISEEEQILDHIHDILATAGVTTNLVTTRTTTVSHRERQTSQTGKGGAHDQNPPHHHQRNTRDPQKNQRVAPQRETTRLQPLRRINSDRARNQSTPIHPNPHRTIAQTPTSTKPPKIATNNVLQASNGSLLREGNRARPQSLRPQTPKATNPNLCLQDYKWKQQLRQRTKGAHSSSNNVRWRATSPTTRPTPITNGLLRRNQAWRKFASTMRLPHKKIQRSILIAELDLREYMKDAPASQFASVNAIDGRGGNQKNDNNGTDKHSSLRATSHQPISNGGDKNTKALMATAARRV